MKPIFKEGIKPEIFRGEEVKQTINKGVQNLPVQFRGTRVEKEIMKGTSVRQSIIKNSVLPTDFRPVEVKAEIGGDGEFAQGMEREGSFNYGMRTSGVHKEIHKPTSIRPSIIKKNVLPTINGGVKVLKTIFGGTTSSNVDGDEININNEFQIDSGSSILNTQYQMDSLGNENIINSTASVHKLDINSNTYDYNTKVKELNLENINRIHSSQVGFQGNIIGVGAGVRDNAVDVTYSTKPDHYPMNI